MTARGWQTCDFIFVSGDAYVDHPSFGPALIGRWLEKHGYRVGIISQPDWTDPTAFQVLGRPRLAFLVSGGNMDSMVLHYTSSKKPRREDFYTPGKAMGKRPDRATIVYCAALRQAWKQVPLIIGGIETSLRRLGHYDYWSDKVRRSIILDAKADLGVYGMGEQAILTIARRLDAGEAIDRIHDVPGTFFRRSTLDGLPKPEILPAFDEVQTDPRAYAESFRIQYMNTNPHSGKPLAESYGNQWVYQLAPAPVLDQGAMDAIYDLPFEREAHPRYREAGGIAALEEVQYSLISTRGCFGACSFCALAFHQGRNIQTRSHESLVAEAEALIRMPGFKGYIHDVGGPTANFRQNPCAKADNHGVCTHRRCLAPSTCKNLQADHRDFLALLRKLRRLQGVKKVFVRSGIRFDYLMADPDRTFFKELVEHHISGQLKVAPEHVSKNVLALMGKPEHQTYEGFRRTYATFNAECGKNQFLVPYFISGHPGATLADALEMARYLRATGFVPEQVQDFYPTPGTLATAMYHTGLDPLTMKPVAVVKDAKEKAMQRALLQFHLEANWSLVRQALIKLGREDLIGTGKDCLLPPFPGQRMKKVSRGGSSDQAGGAPRTKPTPGSGPSEGQGGRRGTTAKAAQPKGGGSAHGKTDHGGHGGRQGSGQGGGLGSGGSPRGGRVASGLGSAPASTPASTPRGGTGEHRSGDAGRSTGARPAARGGTGGTRSSQGASSSPERTRKPRPAPETSKGGPTDPKGEKEGPGRAPGPLRRKP